MIRGEILGGLRVIEGEMLGGELRIGELDMDITFDSQNWYSYVEWNQFWHNKADFQRMWHP